MFLKLKIRNLLKIDNCPPEADPPSAEKLNTTVFRCYDAS
jgi:hypothetical protein